MSIQKKKHKQAKTEDSSLSTLFRSSARGAAIGLLLSVVLAVVICAAILGLDDPDALIFPLSLAALYASAFIAGLVATAKNGGSALVSGLLSGGIFMLVYMLVSLFFPAELSARYGIFASLLFRVLIIVFSILGGYAATAKPHRSHKPKRR